MRFRVVLLAACAVLGWSARESPAVFVTQLTVVNEANVSNAFPPGSVYATVQVLALDSDTVQFTVTPNDALFGVGNTVKVFQFGFNYDSAATGALTINEPAGWSEQGSGNMDGFGSFLERIGGGGAPNDKDPLVFTVDTANSFGDTSDLEAAFFEENAQGRHYAAHMRGFDFNGTTSAFFSDGGQLVPVPPTIVMAAIGLIPFAGVAGIRRLRRKG